MTAFCRGGYARLGVLGFMIHPIQPHHRHHWQRSSNMPSPIARPNHVLLDGDGATFILRFMLALRTLCAAVFCLVLQLAVTAAELNVPEDIQFDKGIEYANPD